MVRRRILAALVPLAMLAALAVPATVAASETTAYADMFGDEVVPGPGSDEEAFAALTIDPDAGTLCWNLKLGVNNATAAELHEGAFGEAGPMVADLSAPLDAGCLDSLDAGVLQAIIDTPDAYYVQVSSTDFPDGAVRGQLYVEPPAPVILFAVVTGANVVPGPGDPTIEANAEIEIDVDAGNACAYWWGTGLETVTAAELQAGGEGVAGELVAAFEAVSGGDTIPYGCATGLDPAVLQAIVDEPAGYYLSIITPDFPDGAARGQLTVEPPPPPPCGPPDVCGGTLEPGDYTWYGSIRPLSFTLDAAWDSSLTGIGLGLFPDDASAVYTFPFWGELSDGTCAYVPTQIENNPAALAAALSAIGSLNAGPVVETSFGGLPALQIDITASLPDACASLPIFPGFGGVVDDGTGGGTDGGGSDGSTGGTVEPGDVVGPLMADDQGGFGVGPNERVRFLIQDLGGEVVVVALDNFAGDGFEALLDQAAGFMASASWGEVALPEETGGAGDGGAGDDGGGVPDTALPAGQPAMPLGLLGVLVVGGLIGLTSLRLKGSRVQA